MTLKISVPVQNVFDKSFANIFRMSADTYERHFVFTIYFFDRKEKRQLRNPWKFIYWILRVALSEQLTQFLVIFEYCDEIFLYNIYIDNIVLFIIRKKLRTFKII